MSNRKPPRQKWKVIVNVVTVLALVVLVYGSRKQLGDTLHQIKHVHIWALLLLIPIEALNYHAQAKQYQRLFRLVGNKLTYLFLLRTSIELNFVNHVFPSGGVTGISYFGLRLRKGEEISGGKATLVQVMKLALTFLSFEVLILLGVIFLAAKGHVNSVTLLVAGSLSTLLLVGTVLFVYIVGSRTRIDSFFTTATRAINRLISLVWRNHRETINVDRVRGVFNDFHDNYKELKRDYKQLQAPFWWAFVTNVTEVAAVYVVYIAFGHLVNLGAVILAYAVANFAGLVSVLPGGVGIYETLMTAVLASTGIPPGISLPVTVMYRVLNTLLQVPPGYYLYQRSLRRQDKPEVASVS